jgi:hypothetical protein
LGAVRVGQAKRLLFFRIAAGGWRVIGAQRPQALPAKGSVARRTRKFEREIDQARSGVAPKSGRLELREI